MWQLVAASVELDLMVIGTHKTGFIHEALYGSGTLPLVAAAACPVVVIPVPGRSEPAGIVVGADESAPGRAALRFATQEAVRTGEVLTILRVWDASADRGGRAWEAAGRRAAEDLVERCAADVSGRHPGLHVRGRTVDGRPAPVLVAASSDSRLLVLGDAQTSVLDHRALGVVSHDVLINIRAPTAIVHGGDCSSPRLHRDQPGRAMAVADPPAARR
jgi:nucleotide-binding universal stress UspA family protein